MIEFDLSFRGFRCKNSIKQSSDTFKLVGIFYLDLLDDQEVSSLISTRLGLEELFSNFDV